MILTGRQSRVCPATEDTVSALICGAAAQGRRAACARTRAAIRVAAIGCSDNRDGAPEHRHQVPGPILRRVSSTVVEVDITSLIETRPGVRSGKPCFVGTRIAVYDVLEYLASGMSSEEIVSDFPELTPEHVRAAIEFAALRERRLATA